MVGEEGAAPTTSEESGFTVRRVCWFATHPLYIKQIWFTDLRNYLTLINSSLFVSRLPIYTISSSCIFRPSRLSNEIASHICLIPFNTLSYE